MSKRLVIYGFIVGIVAGFFAALYRLALEKMAIFRGILFSNLTIFGIIVNILSLVTMSIIVHLFLKFEPLSSGSGIPQVQAENQGYVKMNPIKILVAKFAGGLAGGIGGLSLGREGPSIQIGAAAGKLCSKKLKCTKKQMEYLISAGASAGLSAAFNAPIAGTLFTLEEMHKKFKPNLLVPSLIASVTADFISENIFGIKPLFSFTITNTLSLYKYYHLIIFAIIVGIMGVLFNKLLILSLKIYDNINIPTIIKRFIPFAVMGILGYRAYLLLGGGHNLISDLESTPVSISIMILIFLFKLLVTCICYGSGAQGGIFLPVVVLGGVLGSIYYMTMNVMGIFTIDYYTNFIILGMAGYLTAVVRSPILSIMLVTEMTGNFDDLLSTALVSIIAYVTANLTNIKPIYESLFDRLISPIKNINKSKLCEN